MLATITISNEQRRVRRLLDWIIDHAPGSAGGGVVEGTRSYGLGLARAVTAAGLMVIECEQPHRKARRGRGKSDPIDAHLAVLTALQYDVERLRPPRADGDREALRILLGARHDLTTAHTAQTNRLRELLARQAVTTPTGRPPVLRRPGCPGRPGPALQPPRLPTAPRRRGRRAATARDRGRDGGRAQANRAQLQTIVEDLTPGLTDRRGVGPVSAAQVIVSFSHPGRCRNDGAFAALAGTNPLEASGRTVRHRLNRGGDRALNRACAHHRPDQDAPPRAIRAYGGPAHRRGQDHREICCCLKLDITRELYRALTTTMTPAATPAHA